jgi:hypothetical protein
MYIYLRQINILMSKHSVLVSEFLMFNIRIKYLYDES